MSGSIITADGAPTTVTCSQHEGACRSSSSSRNLEALILQIRLNHDSYQTNKTTYGYTLVYTKLYSTAKLT